MIYALEQKTPS